MTDETGKTGDEGEGGENKFDPKSLGPEGQEYLKRTIQAESARKTALATKELQDKTDERMRQAAVTAEQNEIDKLIEAGDLEAVGATVAAQRSRNSVKDRATIEAAVFIEKSMGDSYTEELGAEAVEEIRQGVQQAGGAHAEFAQALAKASAAKNTTEEIRAEIRAEMIAAGTKVREEVGGASKIIESSQGNPPSTWEETQDGYARGDVPEPVYAAALKAHKEEQAA